MKKYAFFILLFLFSSSITFSQNISGVVVNENTTNPISYTEVLSEKFGFMTGENGQFILDSSLINICDTLIFQCLGYKPQKIATSSLAEDKQNIIKLKRENFHINEVVIYGTKPRRTIKRGFYKKRDRGSFGTSGLAGGEVAIYISNKRERKGKIKNVSFFIRKQGRPTDKFRIHIYAAENKDLPPGKDLLHESIYTHASKGDTWVTINLEKYNIDYPASGFFVSMEFLEDSKAIREYNKTNYWVSGNKLNLGMNWEKQNEGYTWTYSYKRKQWTQFLPPPDKKNYYTGNAMITAEINLY